VLPIDSRIQQDTVEIVELITNNLHKKYVEPFEEMLKNQCDILSENPPPEIGLLSALKPFVDNECCAVIDKLVYSYSLATLSKVMAEDLLHSRRYANASASVSTKLHPDTTGGIGFSNLSVLIPLIILLIFLETH